MDDCGTCSTHTCINLILIRSILFYNTVPMTYEGSSVQYVFALSAFDLFLWLFYRTEADTIYFLLLRL